MGTSARIYSAQALEDFRAKLVEFRQDVIEALAAADAGLQQMYDWLEQQLKHWRHEEQKRSEILIRARRELEEKRHASAKDHRGYTEQEVAYRKARQRLEEAEEKGKRCRAWSKVLPQHQTEYNGPARTLAGMMETEVVRALTLLRQKVDLLAEYQSLKSGMESSDGATSTDASTAPVQRDNPLSAETTNESPA